MTCEIIERPNSLIRELKKQREFLLLNVQFAETKIFNKKDKKNETN